MRSWKKLISNYLIESLNSNVFQMDLKYLINHKIYGSSLSNIGLELPCVINTINSHSYCEAKKDKTFADALLNSDILLPDGVGIVFASKILTSRNIRKIAGADIHKYLLQQANKKHRKVFYLGASKDTLYTIEKKIKQEFPNIEVSSYSPPYKSEFSIEDTNAMLAAINMAGPDILFVGMTAPKQEKWVHTNKEKIQVNMIVSIGAVFDFYSGKIRRPSPFWIKYGLEWLPRLLKEPKRLWKRNFISTPLFLLEVIKEKVM